MKFEYDRELTKQLKLIKMESLLQLTLGAAAIIVLISRAASKSKTSTSQCKDQKDHPNRDQEDELIFTSLIVRHGARGPTRKSLYLAVGETPEQKQARKPDQHADKDHPATATQAAQLWKINELDALTTVGAAQLVSNGQQFARYLQSHPNLLQSNTLIKLRRSERPRVIASANSFIEGYTIIQQQQQQQQQTSKNINTIIPPTLPSLHYQPYPSLQANINVFRAWTGKEYNTAMTEMKTSEHYQKKGEEAATSRVLDATVCKICAPWANQMNRAGQLNLTTYLHEVLGCEEYFPDPSKRGFGSLTDFFRNKKELKKDLIQLAHWSFDQRFINRDTVGKEWGMKIGGDLLNEIEQDYQQSKGDGGSKVSIYVGHDYTILSLMAALGVKKHPKEIMGFGGWARMEYRRNRKTGVVRQCLMLQTVPFPDLKDSSRASEKIPEKVYERISTNANTTTTNTTNTINNTTNVNVNLMNVDY